jgi:hypothetical protein
LKKPPKIEKHRRYSLQIFCGKSGAFSSLSGNCLEMLILDIIMQNKSWAKKILWEGKTSARARFFWALGSAMAV